MDMLFFCMLMISFIGVSTKNHYNAGVANFADLREISSYTSDIQLASKYGVDIIIFPELGLNQTSFGYLDIEEIEVGTNPCNDGKTKSNPLQYEMSCAASDAKIYVVWDMAEKGEDCEKGTPLCLYGYYVYNTAIVLARNGTIISKYRKHNPWINTYFKPGPNTPTYFDTDFGVRLGYYICFDLLFTHPATDLLLNDSYGPINNILYPTWWIDGLTMNVSTRFNNKFLSAIQAQQGYSLFYHINLLASCGMSSSNGCGIFSDGVTLNSEYNTKSDTILYAKVPIFDPIPPPVIQKKTNPPKFQTEFDSQSIRLYAGNSSSVELKLSVGTCTIEYDVERGNANGELFEFVAFRDQVKNKVFFDVCGIVNCGRVEEVGSNCSNDKPSTFFKSLKINMNFDDDIRMIMPLVSAGRYNKLPEAKSYQFEIIVNATQDKYIVQSTENLAQPVEYVFNTAVLYHVDD